MNHPWRAEVLARVIVLDAMTDEAEASATATRRTAAVCARIRQLLRDVEAACAERTRLRDWRSGGPIERAWRGLHSAEILLAEIVEIAELASQLPSVRSLAERVLPASDKRAIAIEKRLCDDAWKDAGTGNEELDNRLRREYIAALTWVSDACDKNFTRVRSFRNIVLATASGLAVVALALGVYGAASPTSLPLCFDASTITSEEARGGTTATAEGGDTSFVCPTGAGADRSPTPGDATLLLAVGLAAGAFSAAIAVRGLRGTSTPYGVPVAMVLLKLPAGALTALLGMLLMHGGFVPGLTALDTQGQIIAWAIVLGYAQQLFTRLIDDRAQQVLKAAPSSDVAAATTPSAVTAAISAATS
jgi:hypothetical protein